MSINTAHLTVNFSSEIYNIFDKFIEAETNKKLQLRLDELLHSLKNEQTSDNIKIILECVDKQRYPIQTILRLTNEKKKRSKKDIDPEKRCMARTGLNTQCRRPRLNLNLNLDLDLDLDLNLDLNLENTRYCQSHTYSLPYNDIEKESKLEEKIVKKRGRRGKNKELHTENLDTSKYIPSVVMDIDGTSYLVDQNDVIYNFNTNNEIVGYIKEEQVHWF